MRFVILGHPRTKKTSQQVVRDKSGFTRIIPSKVTMKWSNDAQLQLQSQFGKYRSKTFREGQRWNLRAVFYRSSHTTADLINHIQALADVLQGAEVIANDKYISGLDGCRLEVDKARPRVEIELTEMGAEDVRHACGCWINGKMPGKHFDGCPRLLTEMEAP